jgi:hypothetical protein
MSKLSLAITIVFATLLGGGAALSSQAAPAPSARTAASDQAAPSNPGQEEAFLACNRISCHSNDDCGFPDLCGGCIRSSGSFFGHCAPTP